MRITPVPLFVATLLFAAIFQMEAVRLPLARSGLIDGTKSLAFIVDDPDALGSCCSEEGLGNTGSSIISHPTPTNCRKTSRSCRPALLLSQVLCSGGRSQGSKQTHQSPVGKSDEGTHLGEGGVDRHLSCVADDDEQFLKVSSVSSFALA